MHISLPQYLGMTVKTRDLKGQARAFSTLAGLYEESRQLVKAHELYWNVRIVITCLFILKYVSSIPTRTVVSKYHQTAYIIISR